MAREPIFPTQVNARRSVFDRLADVADRWVSRPWFFAACVALVVVWLPTGLLVGYGDLWHLLINTPTTIVTFLVVGLSANTARRTTNADHHKLNAVAFGVLRMLDTLGHGDTREAIELRAAIGVEQHESS